MGLPLDTQIRTTSGCVALGDIRPGQTMVLDRDGLLCRVDFVTPVIADLNCYEVKFDTGEVVVCDEQHLWLTSIGGDPVETAKLTPDIAATIGLQHWVRVAAKLFYAPEFPPPDTPSVSRSILWVFPTTSVPTASIIVGGRTGTFCISPTAVPSVTRA